MRPIIVAGNWKMHTTPADAAELARVIAARTRAPGVTRVFCPPFVCLAAVRDALAGEDVAVGAQDVHHERVGAYTGDIAADMLEGLASWVIVGHSERRRYHHETNEVVGEKAKRAIEAGLRPILCVGEDLEVREQGAHVAEALVVDQVIHALQLNPGALDAGLVIAYEPVWAIGTGRSASGADAAAMAAAIRRAFRQVPEAGRGEDVPILYGGSVTAGNADQFFAEPEIDGALVGGASLKPDEMAGIVARAAMTAAQRAASFPADEVTAATDRPRPIVLVVIDGFGIGADPAADAIAAARMPAWRGLLARWPHARLEASGEAVGLPAGQMGNSEVGHLNIGAGRPVLQDLPRIDAAIADGSFFDRPALVEACDRALATGGRLSVVGLVGPGGVHAHDRHIVALAKLARRRGVPRFRLHALLDGRDTPPRSALGFVAALEEQLGNVHPDARIASVGGRYFAMDRDTRWDRIERGYDAIVHGVGEAAPTAYAAIEAAYARDETDEFVLPTRIGAPEPLEDGEPIVHANFRADRARQLTHALADAEFSAFERTSPTGRPAPLELFVATMTEYEGDLPVAVAFAPEVVPCLAGAIAAAGLRQLHVAETEKYAHVTYFLNGGREEPFPGEDRILVPSPKVATYDLQPAMSAAGVTDALLEGVRSGRYDFLVANFANPDMVGHTGDWDATLRAVETVDACLGRIADALEPLASSGALLVITADHGNADAMRTPEGGVVTAHSLSPVPILIAGEAIDGHRLRDGVLADVAPTIASLGALEPWPGMTGRSLVRD